MRYIRWIWTNMAGIRWNTAIRIITGITQVLLGLLMIWLSKQFIDITIRVGTRARISTPWPMLPPHFCPNSS